MKALIIGLGSIGTRHAKNLLASGIVVSGIEPNAEMRALPIPYVNSIAEAEADFAVICSPTDLHLPQAIDCAKKGMHLFIEKPPSNNLKGFDGLKKICKAKKLVCMVACNFRFTDGLQLVKKLAESKIYGKLIGMRAYFGQYLPDMRKGRDYRQLYAAGPAGGVILDSFHEFDYVFWFLGLPKKLSCHKAKVSSLEIMREDIADINLDYNGAMANIHVDYLRRKYKRSCEFIFENATVLWKYKADEQREIVEAYAVEGQKILLDNALDVNKMYAEEMRHFLDCVTGSANPTLGLSQAEKELKLVLKVLK